MSEEETYKRQFLGKDAIARHNCVSLTYSCDACSSVREDRDDCGGAE